MQKQRFMIYTIFQFSMFVLIAVVFAFSAKSVNAQMFDDAELYQDTAESSSVSESNKLEKKTSNVASTIKSTVPSRFAKKKARTPENNKVVVKEVQEAKPIDPNEKIYMYMRDFKISHNLNGIVSCNMRFYLYSKVNEKINNVSYRLKWPKIETPLSFSNVETESPVYKDYTLLGDGCYDLDAAPNIIVNRCRIKGRTQQHCSSIIQWTK